jgi:hypothetical protein
VLPGGTNIIRYEFTDKQFNEKVSCQWTVQAIVPQCKALLVLKQIEGPGKAIELERVGQKPAIPMPRPTSGSSVPDTRKNFSYLYYIFLIFFMLV